MHGEAISIASQGMDAAVHKRVHGAPGDALEVDLHLMGCCRRILSDALADLIGRALCAGQILGGLFGFPCERGRQFLNRCLGSCIDEPHRAGQRFELQPHQADG